MFSTLSKTNQNICVTFTLLSANAFNLAESKTLSFGKEFTLSQTIPGFYLSAVKIFLKYCGKRNFSFSHSVSTLLVNFQPFSSNSKLSYANAFSLEESKILLFGKGLTHVRLPWLHSLT